MRDAGTALRRAYWLALNGNLTVDGDNVPVYYGKVQSTISVPLYVLIGRSTYQSKNSKSCEAEERTVEIDIYQKQPTEVSMEEVEDVSDQILQIVKPTTKTIGVSIASPFKIIVIKLLDNDDDKPQQLDDKKFVVGKSLRFRNHITQ